MKSLHYPLDFHFKIFTPSNDFTVNDADGNTIAYTRQKMFKLKEAIEVFRNEKRQERLYTIQADRILDFNAAYLLHNEAGEVLGSVRRKGMRSLWRTHYQVYNAQNELIFDIQEANPWIAVLDGLVGEIPVVGLFTGYFFNPSYRFTTPEGDEHYRLEKRPSLVERRFRLAPSISQPKAAELSLLGAMVLMLFERGDG